MKQGLYAKDRELLAQLEQEKQRSAEMLEQSKSLKRRMLRDSLEIARLKQQVKELRDEIAKRDERERKRIENLSMMVEAAFQQGQK